MQNCAMVVCLEVGLNWIVGLRSGVTAKNDFGVFASFTLTSIFNFQGQNVTGDRGIVVEHFSFV